MPNRAHDENTRRREEYGKQVDTTYLRTRSDVWVEDPALVEASVECCRASELDDLDVPR